MGDINVDLDNPENDCNDTIAEQLLDEWGLEKSCDHFYRSVGKKNRGNWTWHRHQKDKNTGRVTWISKQLDYVMFRHKDRNKFSCSKLKEPRHHSSDHRAVVCSIASGPVQVTRAYRDGRKRFPISVGKPSTKHEVIFEELIEDCKKAPKREQPALSWISKWS